MKKNYGILIGLAVLLVVAVFVNVRINKNTLNSPRPTLGIAPGTTAAGNDTVNAEQYFETFREDRENVRDKELSYLETIILHDQTDAETLQDAQQQKIAIVDSMEKEFTVESLLKAKGFLDSAVTFHKGSVNVIIQAEELSPSQAAQILDIVCRETGEEAKNVKISTLK